MSSAPSPNVARYDIQELSEAWLAGDAARTLRIIDGLRSEGEPITLAVWQLGEDLHALAGVHDAMAQRPVVADRRAQRSRVGQAPGRRSSARRGASTPAQICRCSRALARLDALAKGLGRGDPWDALVAHRARAVRDSPRADRRLTRRSTRSGTCGASRTPRPPARSIVTTMMIGTISTILSATIINVAFPGADRRVPRRPRHAAMGRRRLSRRDDGDDARDRVAGRDVRRAQRRSSRRSALFLAASLLAAASWSTDALIAARVLQGAAAGILQPLAMIVLFRVFPVEERGRAMALYGFGIVLAPAIGPAIGGTLLDAFGWRSIFLLTVPFCIAGLVLGARTLPTRAPARASRASTGSAGCCCWPARWSRC